MRTALSRDPRAEARGSRGNEDGEGGGRVSPDTRHEGPETSTLHDDLRVVRRRKWVIARAALLVPRLAVAVSLQQQKQHQGTAEVWLNQQNQRHQVNGGND